MKALVKPALALGLAGAMALGSMTVSQARGFHHRGAFVAGAAGFAAGAAIGAAAANSYGYYGDPGYAYTGDPAYGAYAYAQGYDSYAYAPGYRGYGGYGYGASTRSAPAHYDPGYGYNSNTIAPWQERRLEGNDY